MNIRETFIKSVESNNTKTFKYLLKNNLVEPCILNNWAIRTAAQYGFVEIFNLLLNDPRVNPVFDDNCILLTASANGHLQIVKLILDDKRINSNFIDTAFEFAYFNNYISVARTLWNNKRFNKYKKNFDKKTYFKIYIQEHINNF